VRRFHEFDSIDALPVRDMGQPGQAWRTVKCVFAVREGRAVVTLNRRDFLQLHRDVPGSQAPSLPGDAQDDDRALADG